MSDAEWALVLSALDELDRRLDRLERRMTVEAVLRRLLRRSGGPTAA